ncbi:site-2 protease family protein [Evansella sp. AB-P1]|uniref:site-2 protease family protein n=1 Tax=Evansella sp. AB-P1 TaxID=3037653 RepID=UPI00241D8DB5|nr:site-2 protease family protein [Evansella sp. AB-P1]MDG5786800.1 site-2 protease family protein [Evansella sp. AB-P1]
MFELSDLARIIYALFIVFPLVSFIHELGHLLFACLFGAKNFKMTIGCGKPIFKYKFLEIRKYYFWYSWCYYSDLEKDNRLTNILVYSGPMILNLSAALLVNWLTIIGVLDSSILWYQFVYFSIYFVIFDLIPMTYHDGQPSNGRVIYELLRYGNKVSFEKGDFNEEAEKMRENNRTTKDR